MELSDTVIGVYRLKVQKKVKIPKQCNVFFFFLQTNINGAKMPLIFKDLFFSSKVLQLSAIWRQYPNNTFSKSWIFLPYFEDLRNFPPPTLVSIFWNFGFLLEDYYSSGFQHGKETLLVNCVLITVFFFLVSLREFARFVRFFFRVQLLIFFSLPKSR